MPARFHRSSWRLFLIYSGLLLVGFWFFHTMKSPTKPREVSYDEFLDQITADHLDDVRISERELIGKFKSDYLKSIKNGSAASQIVSTGIPGLDAGPLVELLRKHHVQFSGTKQGTDSWLAFLIAFGPMLLLVIAFGLAFRRMHGRNRGPLSFGRNRAKIHDTSTHFDTKFADVAGVEEAKLELQEIIDFLSRPQKYQKLGGRIPKGVLLVGPPGTGKTLLARAVAGEAQVPFFSISGSEFVEMFVGVGASRVRDLFEQAKQRAPCIVFIDELDAIGRSRAGAQVFPANGEREQTLNQLLVEMDGFDTSKAVIIMAATNRPEVLDPALLRPGRFDRQVVLDRPDLTEREAILQVHSRRLKISRSVNLNSIAAETPGMVGADLANIVNEAALNAARRDADQIEMTDFENAVDRVVLGFEKKGRLISPEEKERVACHEVGHALVALSVPNADPVRRVSIIPRSIGSLGHTLQLPTKDHYLLTEPEIVDRIAIMLGGRGAEEIVFDGVVSTGANDDLERTSELARRMVTRYGMGKQLGILTYGVPSESRYLKTPFGAEEKNYSERTAEQIDAEVRKIIDSQYDRVKLILQKRRTDLDLVVRELIKRETLQAEELGRLLDAERV